MAFSQPLYQSSVSHVTTSTTYYHGKCVLIYKYTIWMYGGSNFQNNIKKHLPHILFEIAWVGIYLKFG